MNRYPVLAVLGALFIGFLTATSAVGADAKPLTVDYVIGMLESGTSQDAIIKHILDRNLFFTASAEDLERLHQAGAGERLLGVVTGRSEQMGEDWSHPQRLDSSETYQSEGTTQQSDSGNTSVYFYGGFGAYWPWYGYYPGSYASFGYYYPYYSPYYYPYYRYPYYARYPGYYPGHYPGHSPSYPYRGLRGTPRGTPPPHGAPPPSSGHPGGHSGGRSGGGSSGGHPSGGGAPRGAPRGHH